MSVDGDTKWATALFQRRCRDALSKSPSIFPFEAKVKKLGMVA